MADISPREVSEGTPADAPTDAPSRELGFVGVGIGALAISAAFGLLWFAMAQWHPPTSIGPDYTSWLESVLQSIAGRLQWFMGDMTEPLFYKSWLASIGLLIGALFAWALGKYGSRFGGFAISYGTGLWPWLIGASSLSLALSNVAFGWMVKYGWQPTFVPFVCVAAATVLIYGSGWRVLVTGATLGALITTPLAMLLIATVTGPLGLPAVVANTLSMSLGAAFCFWLYRHLPWMTIPQPVTTDTTAPVRTVAGAPSVMRDAVWTVRRVLADFTETQFFANEWASLGVIVGVVAAFLLNPLFPAYGSEVLPQILMAQALTSALGVLLWRGRFRAGGWAGTYISVVSVAPAAVLAYNGSPLSIVLGALLGAVLCPPLARLISSWLPSDFHPFIGNTTSMAISVTVVLPIIGAATTLLG